MELTPLKRPLALRRSKVGTLDLFEGDLDGRPVVAIVTGMGTAAAADHVTRLLDAIEVARVVVVGIAGSVEPDVVIGTLVLPQFVVDEATGARYRPERLGPGDQRGTMWTSNSLITDGKVADQLVADGVVALDMETGAIAGVCEGRGIPWSVFRCISDRVADGTVDDELLGLSRPDGSPDVRAAISYVVRHPTRIPGLARTARGAKMAAGHAADSAVKAVSAAPPPGG
jgi:adenosylhomocysteine nucleosidase